MFALLAAVTVLAAPESQAPAPQSSVREGGCSLIVETSSKPEIIGPLAGLHVLDGPEELPVVVAPGGKLQGVICIRSSIVPDARDDRVPRSLGVPLFLRRDNPDAITELNRKGEGFSVVRVNGAWTDDEKRQIIARIQLFNSR